MDAPANPAQRHFSFDRTALFDIRNTQALSELFATPRANRDDTWLTRLFPALWTASLEVGTPSIFQGPDFFRYIRLHLPEPAKPFDSNCVANLAQQALDNAWGMAIFASPTATEPEYVLTMGVLDSLVTYDSWRGDPLDLADLPGASATPQQITKGLQRFDADQDSTILTASPAAIFLPPHTARALHFHLQQGWKIPEPRVSLLVNPAMTPARNLVINRKFNDFPDAVTATRQGNMLLWYLPPKRGLLLMPQSWNESQMRPLTDYFPQPAS